MNTDTTSIPKDPQVPSKRHRGERWRTLRALAEDVPLFLTAPLYRSWHLRWDATEAEVNARLPGDELQPQAQFRATRAITIEAPTKMGDICRFRRLPQHTGAVVTPPTEMSEHEPPHVLAGAGDGTGRSE